MLNLFSSVLRKGCVLYIMYWRFVHSNILGLSGEQTQLSTTSHNVKHTLRDVSPSTTISPQAQKSLRGLRELNVSDPLRQNTNQHSPALKPTHKNASRLKESSV